MGGGIVGGQRPAEGDGFLGGFQRLPYRPTRSSRMPRLSSAAARSAWWAAGLSAASARQQGDGFLGGFQRLPVPAHPVQPEAEIVQRGGEVGLVGGGVVGGQRPARVTASWAASSASQYRPTRSSQTPRFVQRGGEVGLVGGGVVGGQRPARR